MIETDAPYMTRDNAQHLLMNPRRNEPSTLPFIAHTILECYNNNNNYNNNNAVVKQEEEEEQETKSILLTLHELSDQIRENTNRFFNLSIL